jgi:hypothetical protein
MHMSVDVASPRPVASVEPGYETYRAMSSAAVAALVLGVLSPVAFFDVTFALVPLCGILIAARALWSIRRQPDELTGRGVAIAGLVCSAAFFTTSVGMAAFEYATEVPDGYGRVTFEDLRPADGASEHVVPDAVKALDGQRVFIKGYMRPGAQDKNIENFLLVRDNGACCFGNSLPAAWDMIEVKLKEPLLVDYHTGQFKMAGTFRIDPNVATHGMPQVPYSLEADYKK